MAEPAKPQYRVCIESPLGDVEEMASVIEFEYSHYLNSGSDAVIVLPINDEKVTPTLIVTRQSYVRIYRLDNSNAEEVIVWYGQVYDTNCVGDDISGKMTLYCENIFNLLAHRTIPYDYAVTTSTDQSDIAWNLIDYTQGLTGGDLGIVRGAHPPSKDRTAVTELQRRTIRDAIISYSTINDGFDFDVTPTMTQNTITPIFNTYFTTSGARYHKGGVLATPLVYHTGTGSDDSFNNIISYDFTEKGGDLTNFVDVDGQATDEVPITSSASDTGSISRFGLFQKYFNESDISEQATLDDKANEYLDLYKTIPLEIHLTTKSLVRPRIGTYDVGDIFIVDFHIWTARAFKAQYRVYGIRVKVTSDGVEQAKLDLNIL